MTGCTHKCTLFYSIAYSRMAKSAQIDVNYILYQIIRLEADFLLSWQNELCVFYSLAAFWAVKLLQHTNSIGRITNHHRAVLEITLESASVLNGYVFKWFRLKTTHRDALSP